MIDLERSRHLEGAMRRILAPLIPLALALLPACGGPTDDGQQGEWPEPQWPTLRSEQPHDTAPQLDADEVQAFAQDNRLFALDLYHQLRQDPDNSGKNLLLSPYSIRTAFGMLYGGATGQGRDEITDALHFSLDGERQHVGFNWLDDSLAARQLPAEESDYETLDPVVVLPANAVFANRNLAEQIKAPYLDLLSIHYGVGVRLADFDGNPEGEREKINEWVEARTRGLIPELLPNLPELTSMVLINALYLKAPWAAPFDGPTLDRDFFALDGSTQTVDMMAHLGMNASYGEGEDYQIVAMPLRNPDLEVIALLPTGDFTSFEATLDETRLAQTLASLQSSYVGVEMPKLSVACTFSLREALMGLGLVTPWSGGSFEDIGGVDKLFEVHHQTVIKADEDGVEAAAATAIVLDDEVGGGEPELTIRLDRPFFLMIRDDPTDTLLFFGRVLDPTGA